MAASGFKDYYEVLGVSKEATEKDIKRAYRKLARQYHPDLNQDNPDAEERFKVINEAHEVLSDPEKRKKYDQFGQYWQQAERQAPAGGSAGYSTGYRATDFSQDFDQYGSFSDFINDLLGRQGRSGSSTGRTYRYTTDTADGFQDFGGFGGDPFGAGFDQGTPSDLEAAITLTFSEAFHGTQKRLAIGSDETITVRIPPGAKSGSRIRIKGKGQISPFSQQRGDLYLTVDLQPHPHFRFVGDNILCTVPIAPWEAALGAQIDVPTPEGKVKMKIPSGVDSGQRLRLKGKGWRNQKGDRTDELIELKIVSPKDLSASEKDYWQKLQQASAFNPRQQLENVTL